MGNIYKKNIDVDRLFHDLLMVGPFGWALIRVQEVYLLSQFTFNRPVLDLACGDGSFAKILKEYQRAGTYDIGVDFDTNELEKAKKSGSYKRVKLADAASLPFNDGFFNTIFSNGSVEHFDNFDQCLSELARVLRKSGICYLTVPTDVIGKHLFFPRLMRFLRLGIFADMYELFFNKLFKHKNLYDHVSWKRLLKRHNLMLESYAYYNYDPVVPSHDIMLWFNSWNFIVKRLTGNWFLFPMLRVFTAPFEQLLFKGLINTRNETRKGPSLLLVIKK